MPKETLIIDKFHGGTDSHSDPRDILNETSKYLKGVDVSRFGKIRMNGTVSNHAASTNSLAGVNIHASGGTGFFMMQHANAYAQIRFQDWHGVANVHHGYTMSNPTGSAHTANSAAKMFTSNQDLFFDGAAGATGNTATGYDTLSFAGASNNFDTDGDGSDDTQDAEHARGFANIGASSHTLFATGSDATILNGGSISGITAASNRALTIRSNNTSVEYWHIPLITQVGKVYQVSLTLKEASSGNGVIFGLAKNSSAGSDFTNAHSAGFSNTASTADTTYTLTRDFVASDTSSAFFMYMTTTGTARWATVDDIKIYEADPCYTGNGTSLLDTTTRTTQIIKTGASTGQVNLGTGNTAYEPDLLIGMRIDNLTDGSYSYITDNTATNITMSRKLLLTAGADDGSGDLVLTSTSAHGLVHGQRVYISGMPALSNGNYNVHHENLASTTFQLYKTDDNLDKVAYASGDATGNFSGDEYVTVGLTGGTKNQWSFEDIFHIGHKSDYDTSQATEAVTHRSNASTYIISPDTTTHGGYLWWEESPVSDKHLTGSIYDLGDSGTASIASYHMYDGNLRVTDGSFENQATWYGFLEDDLFTACDKHAKHFKRNYWSVEKSRLYDPEEGDYTSSTSTTVPSSDYAYGKFHRATDDWPHIDVSGTIDVAQDSGTTYYYDLDGGNWDTKFYKEGDTIVVAGFSNANFNGTKTVVGTTTTARIHFTNANSSDGSESGGGDESLKTYLEWVPFLNNLPSLGMSVQHNQNGSSQTDGAWKGRKSYYYSWVYDGYQESLPRKMDNGLLTANYNPNGNLSKKRFRFYVRPGLFFGATDHDSSEANVAGGSTPYSFLNTRITGARVYYREVSDSDNDAQRDDEGDLYLIADLDFRKGKGIRKSPLSSDWIPFQNFDDKDCFRGHSVGSGAEPAPSYTGANNPDDYYIQAETWVEYATPPKSYRYNTLSAISQQEETVYAKYKHSTIVGNTVFIGNVRVMHRGTGYGSYDDERDHPDCIMASPPGVPDAFPASSLEVGMADGDPIMQLESFADRLLIFKKEKLLIYNVSSDIYIQEAEYRLRGINASGAVCKTDMGVAWINEHGAFMFDGEQIYDLQESNKVRKLSISDWDSFYEDTAIIGYDAIARKLVVVKGTESSRTGDAYMVDILTNAWTFHDSFYTDSKVKGNFINHPDGKLILPYEDSSDVKYEVFTPDTPESGDFEYISKDNDFGEPGVRKKIYRVFVTYKLSSGSVPNISYYVNGDTSSSKAFVAETAFSNSGSQWKTAIYRPNVSIEANNIYSLQLKMDRTGMHSSFEINDITISYRMKTVR